MSDSTPLDRFQLRPEIKAQLLDRETMARIYAEHDIKGGAKVLGTGRVPFGVALRYHGIRVRNRGERPPCLQLTRRQVELAVLRAYLNTPDAGCPPSCPGRSSCLDRDECILPELCRG